MIFKRPWLVLLLLIITLVFAASGITRAWTGVRNIEFLDDLAINISPAYLIVSGALWGVLGAISAVLLWWGSRYARQILISGTILYSLNFWFEQFVLMTSMLRKTNWPFLVVFNLLVILIVVLSFRHPRVKEFYGGQA